MFSEKFDKILYPSTIIGSSNKRETKELSTGRLDITKENFLKSKG